MSATQHDEVRSATDRRVDRAIASIADTIDRTPRRDRAAVLSIITATLIDSLIHGAEDPGRAAEQVCEWLAKGLRARGLTASVEIDRNAPRGTVGLH